MCYLLGDKLVLKKKHMHSFIAQLQTARRTKEKEPPQAKEIPKGRSMQTFFGVMVSWHGVMHGVMVS